MNVLNPAAFVWAVLLLTLSLSSPEAFGQESQSFKSSQEFEDVSRRPPNAGPLSPSQKRELDLTWRQANARFSLTLRIEAQRKLLTILKATYGPKHPLTGRFEMRLGNALVDIGELDEAKNSA